MLFVPMLLKLPCLFSGYWHWGNGKLMHPKRSIFPFSLLPKFWAFTQAEMFFKPKCLFTICCAKLKSRGPKNTCTHISILTDTWQTNGSISQKYLQAVIEAWYLLPILQIGLSSVAFWRFKTVDITRKWQVVLPLWLLTDDTYASFFGGLHLGHALFKTATSFSIWALINLKILLIGPSSKQR